jgi:4-hydroxy-2-oxoheptanedioate aldolase
MATPNTLKAALKRGERQLGVWISLGSQTATELVARIGFDWLLIDMEHSTAEVGDVVGHLRAAFGGSAEPMVRVPWNDAVVLKRVLDIGARSLLVPYVQNVEEARRAVAATRYPPAGVRGFSGMTRANDYSANTSYATAAADEIFLAVQLESPEAIANAAEIAAIEGIDGLFIGPNDLAANMGLVGQPYAEPVRAAIRGVLADIKAAGKAAGVLDFKPDSAAEWFAHGYDFVAVGSDISLLNAGARALLKSFR